jgi:hypothetical protein
MALSTEPLALHVVKVFTRECIMQIIAFGNLLVAVMAPLGLQGSVHHQQDV